MSERLSAKETREKVVRALLARNNLTEEQKISVAYTAGIVVGSYDSGNDELAGALHKAIHETPNR